MKNLNAYLYLKKKNFYSSLKDGKRNKSNGHIELLQNVWKIFDFNTFEDFHDHYLKYYY